MREQLLAAHHITAEDGTPVTLQYYLLIEELFAGDGTAVCEIYGARIERRRDEQITEHSVPRITVLGSEILRIIRTLSDGGAAPEIMEDCISDMLA